MLKTIDNFQIELESFDKFQHEIDLLGQ